MNEFGEGDILDKLSLNSLSTSSPSTFQSKARILPNKSANLSHVPCKFFKQGTCTAGTNCIFSHNIDPTSESSVCKYFRKGNCKFGTKCALLHTMSPISVNNKTSSYTDPFLSAPSPSPFSLFLLDESSNISVPQRQASYEPMSYSLPFYQSPFHSTNAIHIPPSSSNYHHQHLNRHDFLPTHNTSFLFEDDGPFIMEDTSTTSICNYNTFKKYT